MDPINKFRSTDATCDKSDNNINTCEGDRLIVSHTVSSVIAECP